ncbi:MAG: NAD(P)H-hydrate epimerase [Clostridia bacterium]|nr:NAD(P)H-hydrate epimerase [Clostridia bacterium]
MKQLFKGIEYELVSVETMRKSDAHTIATRVPSKELMQRAGRGIFEAAQWKGPVAIVCGKGNNAGDGFVVADLLKHANIECTLFLISDSFSEDGQYFFNIATESGVPSEQFNELTNLSSYKSILDCIFGTGFNGDPKDLYKTAIEAINSAGNNGSYIVSADINSGLNGDTGLGVCFVKSDLTVSIGNFKTGHFAGLSEIAMKDKVNVDIGIEIIE